MIDNVISNTSTPNWIKSLQDDLHQQMANDISEENVIWECAEEDDEFNLSIDFTLLANEKSEDEFEDSSPMIPLDENYDDDLNIEKQQFDINSNEQRLIIEESIEFDEKQTNLSPKSTINIYQRLLGEKMLAQIAFLLSTENSIDYASVPLFTSVKDRFMSFMSGETEEERRVRLKLIWYRSILYEEMLIFQKVKLQHENFQKELHNQFIFQEAQLCKLGISTILPMFHMQSWIRELRASLMSQAAIIASKVIDYRFRKSKTIIQHFMTSRSDSNYSLDWYDKFCEASERVICRNDALGLLTKRIAKLDSLCHSQVAKFKNKLHELTRDSSFQNRLQCLRGLIKRYQSHIQVAINLHQGVDDLEEWDDFVVFFTNRNESLVTIEKEFLCFVDNEREKESRLWRHWMVAVRKQKNISLKSIQSFVMFFTDEIVVKKFSIDEGSIDTLSILVECCIFRSLHDIIFRYPSHQLQERDKEWRSKIRLCRLLDPFTYGVSSKYYNYDSLPCTPTGIDDETFTMNEILWERREKLFLSRFRILHRHHYGEMYIHAARILTCLANSLSPREIIYNLLTSMKWLFKDAYTACQSKEPLGADFMFPILVNVLIHSDIPNMYLLLHVIHHYVDFTRQGEANYYATCLEAAISYVFRMDLDEDINISENTPIHSLRDFSSSNSPDTLPQDDISKTDFGEWMNDHDTMEETITILHDEGWMV